MKEASKRALKRTALTLFAFVAGWLTLPLWPIIFAVMVWNDCIDEEEEVEGGAA
ncbi:MAG: hypothetical protein II649_12100 [Kiritimatiellae bacterium]|nr:hypothetical protein [Kiritimatiellia bacterium]